MAVYEGPKGMWMKKGSDLKFTRQGMACQAFVWGSKSPLGRPQSSAPKHAKNKQETLQAQVILVSVC